jgi:hypothetical protein
MSKGRTNHDITGKQKNKILKIGHNLFDFKLFLSRALYDHLIYSR